MSSVNRDRRPTTRTTDTQLVHGSTVNELHTEIWIAHAGTALVAVEVAVAAVIRTRTIAGQMMISAVDVAENVSTDAHPKLRRPPALHHPGWSRNSIKC